MKGLRLPLLGSKTLIQATRTPLFTCVLSCHMIYLKGQDQNLLIFYSVAGVNTSSSRLDNPNFCQFVILGHLPTPALTKRLALYSYGHNYPEGILSQQAVHSANSKLFGGRFGAHSDSASPDFRRMTKYFCNYFHYVPMTC